MTAPSRKSILGYLAAVFLTGIAIGGVTGYTIARTAETRLPAEQKLEEAWLDKYRAALSLTKEQTEAVRQLLPDAVRQVGGVWYRAIMTMGAIQEGVDREIEPLLNDSQRVELEEWIRQSRAERLRIATGRSRDEATVSDDLWFAAATGNLEAIRRHLAEGVDVNRPDAAFGMPAVAVAAVHGQPDAIDLLIANGAEVNQRSADGNSALHGAAFFGRTECVRRLLAHGADTATRNDDDNPPLEAMAADWETIQFIGAVLEVELDKEATLAGREAVAELLRAAEGRRNE
ncbi:MAG: ankyrin repeat domain-containing protein [Verrucomicrobiae bacterium]|nr:ankyrin repeat domain-containing protein [Verrucomicrobiae bacterium]